jgi:hypothetical protein
MSFLRLPEIENTVLFESILADEANFCSRTSIDLLEVRGDERSECDRCAGLEKEI